MTQDAPQTEIPEDPVAHDQPERLMVSGLVQGEGEGEGPLRVEVTRGMAILSCDGQEVGKVAAVVVDNRSQTVTHLLLTRLRLSPEYRLVPVHLIKQVSGESVSLDLCPQIIESLPMRRTA